MAAPTGGDSSGSILKDLLFNQYQAILLGGVAALSAVVLSPLPLVVWLGGECVLLPLLDSVPALRRLVHRRRRAATSREADARRQELVDSLNPTSARRYQAMEHFCRLIEANYQGLHGISQVYLSEQRQKLDVVLEGCLVRLVALQRYERMLALRNTGEVETEITRVQRELAQPDLHERARAALEKNLELKQRLLGSVAEARETRKALSLELDSLGSLLEVLHQTSISMRDPQAISQELDTIVRQSEDSERAVREMEAMLGSDPLSWDSSPASARSPGAEERARRMKGR